MQHSDPSELRRLVALRHLDILNTPRESKFDDLVQIASHLLSAPIALISLVEDTHQWFKACVGIPVNSTSREVSFCAHAIAQENLEQVFVVKDATQDPLFCNNALVTGPPYIRFYAGAPLVTQGGEPIGSLCIIDTKPRIEPTADQLKTLQILARAAVTQMELRKVAEDLRESEQYTRLIMDTATDAVVTVDADGCITDWNNQATVLFGIDKSMVQGKLLSSIVLPADTSEMDCEGFNQLLRSTAGPNTQRHFEFVLKRADGLRFPAEVSASTLTLRNQRMSSIFVRDISLRKHLESERREAETRDVVIYAMARLAESRDPETGAHIERVQSYCKALAEQLAVEGPYKNQSDPEFIRLMYTTSPLHDIGKVGIPDDILLKPGRLSDREFEIMKEHAAIGAETLEAAMARFPNTRFLRMARNIAATHHERYDGSGYPKGLAGEQIPLCGRIVALADVYDALTSRRVYKAAFTHDVARGIIYKDSGKHFDPVIVEAFRAIEGDFDAIYQRFREVSSAAA